MKFLRNLLASILGCLVAIAIFFFIFFVFIALVGSSSDGITVKENSILELSFSEPIYDYLGTDDSDPFGGLFEEGAGLDDILHAIKVAKQDSKITGISITTGMFMGGMAQAQEVRKALLDFKEAGKFVYAYSDYYTQKDYYLASVADEMYINPLGILDFKGLATEVLYYKDLQEKTGLKMEVIRHGKYKSAVEPYLSDTMSQENRSQIKALLQSVWESMLTNISESRNVSVQNLNTIADTLGGRMPEYAVASGLLDGYLYYDEYENLLREELGLDTDDGLNYVDLEDYTEVSGRKKLQSGADKIAVIYAQGEILYGEGGKEYIGQGLLTRALQKAKNNDNIKAIVLRVNSPGGNALTSDIIWREVELVKKVKPVVASFGNMAASGGYYIGVGADKIVAEPTTITGSIGVFGTIPNAHELSATIGINAEQVGTNKNAVDYSLFEPMTASFRNLVKEGIEKTYATFLQRVADGRNLSIDEVDALAQGRVWSGADAQAMGLVDQLGSLDDAIALAAELAELDDYGIRKYPRYKSDFERLMEDLGGAEQKLAEKFIKKEIGTEAFQLLKEVKQITETEGIQARLPYTLKIK